MAKLLLTMLVTLILLLFLVDRSPSAAIVERDIPELPTTQASNITRVSSDFRK